MDLKLKMFNFKNLDIQLYELIPQKKHTYIHLGAIVPQNKYIAKTRMTTFIKTKFKISDDQTNIDKYRLAAYITEYHIISKLPNLLRIIIPYLT